MQLALQQAATALEQGEFPVGCIIVCKDRVVSDGHRVNTASSIGGECDHAEIVALRRLGGSPAVFDPADLTVYVTLEPCLMCFGAILIHGIRKIVYAYEDVMGGGTGCALGPLPPLYQGELEIIKGVLRSQSLKLFKEFFAGSENAYLQNTLLCRHVLEQV